jgi:hypothetical protein
MRFIVLAALIGVALPVPVLAQSTAPVPASKAAAPAAVREPAPQPPRTGPCCVRKVWDARGHEIGDVVDYDERFSSQPLGAYVAYHVKGGDAVILAVSPEAFNGLQGGNMIALFTTPDCSGNSMFAMLSWPPLAKRYAMVLLSGWPPQVSATHAWLWVTDPLPVRQFPPAGTVFHSTWNDSNTCGPTPPGYTVPVASGVGGFPMHRVEDLLAKYHRPFWINY